MPNPSDNNDTLRDVTEQGQHTSFTPTNPTEQRAHSDILRVLADFQTGLESLKSLHAQREALQAELETRRGELAQRDIALAEQRAAFEVEHAELLARREELTAKDARLAEQEAVFNDAVRELASRQDDLAHSRAQLAEKQTELAAKDNRLAEQEAEFQAAVRELAARQDALAARDEQLAVQHAELDAARATVEDQRHALAERDATLAEKADALNVRSKELAAREAELDEARARLASREREVAQLRGAVASAGDSASAQAKRAIALAEEVSLLRIRGDLLFDLAREYEALWHTERHASAGFMVESQSLAARVQELEELSDTLRTQVEEGAALAMDLEKERAVAAELELSLATAQGRLAAETTRREGEARRADEAEATVAERSRMLEAAAQSLAETRGQAQEMAAALTKAQDDNARLRAFGPGRCNAFNKARRERLGRYRVAVRRQVNKVRKASEALGKRMEQVDQIIAQRAELAQARNRIIETERRVQKAAARNKAGVLSLCIVAALGLLAGLSWALAREVAPATFVAQATIKADGRGRDLNEAEMEEWQRYHMELLGNPMFQEAAAERFMRQGFASLGTPSAVAAFVNTSVNADSMAPGEITLLHTGSGKDSTRRVLEAFTASLASFANAAQQRRIDGAATAIPNPSTVDESPLDNTRTYYAIGMLGAGVAFVGGITLGAWRKLSNAKSRFENDSQVAGILEEAKWTAPGRF